MQHQMCLKNFFLIYLRKVKKLNQPYKAQLTQTLILNLLQVLNPLLILKALLLL
jgi:hypothetical protein